MIEPRLPIRPTPIPSGIADAEGSVGYVVASGGGIDAVDLRSGASLWHSGAASRPLLATRGELIAARVDPEAPGRLQVVVLDAKRDGAVLSTSDPIELPPWVDAASADPDELTVEAELHGERLVLRWEAHGRYRGGAPPPERVEAQAQGEAAGTAEIDLRTGRVRVGEPTEVNASTPLPSTAETLSLESAAEVPIPYQVGTSWKTGPWAVEGATAAVHPATEGGVLLRTRHATGARPDEVRISDQADADVRVTREGGYVLVRSAGAAADGEAWEVYPVREPGARTTLALDTGAHDFAVAGGRLVYVAEAPGPGGVRRSLVANDLATGERLWGRELETRAESGPSPLRQAAPPPPGF